MKKEPPRRRKCATGMRANGASTEANSSTGTIAVTYIAAMNNTNSSRTRVRTTVSLAKKIVASGWGLA